MIEPLGDDLNIDPLGVVSRCSFSGSGRLSLGVETMANSSSLTVSSLSPARPCPGSVPVPTLPPPLFEPLSLKERLSLSLRAS